ncbi:unnamed protein product [Boreogadus saida]
MMKSSYMRAAVPVDKRRYSGGSVRGEKEDGQGRRSGVAAERCAGGRAWREGHIQAETPSITRHEAGPEEEEDSPFLNPGDP